MEHRRLPPSKRGDDLARRSFNGPAVVAYDDVRRDGPHLHRTTLGVGDQFGKPDHAGGSRSPMCVRTIASSASRRTMSVESPGSAADRSAISCAVSVVSVTRSSSCPLSRKDSGYDRQIAEDLIAWQRRISPAAAHRPR